MTTRVMQGIIIALPTVAPLSRLDFRWRLSLTEQIALRRIEREHASADVRDTLTILRESLTEVTDAAGVRVTDPRTHGGAVLVIDVLVAAGVIAEADGPTRLAALLAPPV